MPKGFVIGEMGHVAPLLFPASGQGSSDIISMKEYSHASIILLQGAGRTGVTVTVKRSDDNASTTTSAIAFSYYVEDTAGIDLLGARTAATSSGFTLSSGNNQTVVIELDAAELSEDLPYFLIELSSTVDNSNLQSAVAVLSGSRYGEVQSRTVQS